MRKSRVSPDDLETVKILEKYRWPKGVSCLSCKSKEVKFIESRLFYQCNKCRKQFNVFKGTIFEGTRLSPNQLMGAVTFYWENCTHVPTDYGNKRRYERYGARLLARGMGGERYSTAQRLAKKLSNFLKKTPVLNGTEFIDLLFKKV